VVLSQCRPRLAQQIEFEQPIIAEKFDAVERMPAHLGKLFLVKPTRFLEDMVRNTNLANIVQLTGNAQLVNLFP